MNAVLDMLTLRLRKVPQGKMDSVQLNTQVYRLGDRYPARLRLLVVRGYKGFADTS